MNRRTLVEFITGWLLVLIGGIMTILPLFGVINIKAVFNYSLNKKYFNINF